MPWPRPTALQRRWAAGAAALATVAALAWGAGEWAARQAHEAQWDDLRHTAEVQTLALRGVAQRYNYLPLTAGEHPLVQALLQQPGDEALRDAVNRYLQHINQHAGSDMLYVMDARGTTMASSNWDSPQSFVHQNYANRPYFQDALQGGNGRFYGVGKTTRTPGLFVSAPVRQGMRVIGVVAVKVRMEPISDAWASLRDPVFVSDAEGIVFLGSAPQWLYHTTRALPAAQVQRLAQSEQYGDRWQPRPAPWTLQALPQTSGALLRMAASGREYLAYQEPLPELGWTLTVTADRRSVALARQQTWALATLAAGLLMLAALYWQQRERRLRENRLARAQLEQRVQERTQELLQAQAFRQSMEDALLVGMRARDLQGRIVYVNAAMCDMVGYSAQALVGCLPPYPYWHPDHMEHHWQASNAALAGQATPQGFESRLRHRDGSDVYTMVYTARLIDGQGQHVGWMSSVVNITAQKRAEARQQAHEAQLQRVQRIITVGEMASTLAHELNQPLAALVNYAAAARALAGPDQPALLIESLQALSSQARRAADMVGRIRSWVRQHPQTREPCDLREVVDQALNLLLRAEAQRHGVAMAHTAPATPVKVLADRVLLEQVVLNLGLNALQAMQGHPRPPQGHQLRLHTLVQGTQALVQVDDTGPGLPPAVAARLFEPFFTTRADGLGLGLNICRSMVESMGGALQAHNLKDGGARFEMALPLQASMPPDADRPPGASADSPLP